MIIKSQKVPYRITGSYPNFMRQLLGQFGQRVASREFKKFLTETKGISDDCLIIKSNELGAATKTKKVDYLPHLHEYNSNIELAIYLDSINRIFQRLFMRETLDLPELPLTDQRIRQTFKVWPDIIAVWCPKFERAALPRWIDKLNEPTIKFYWETKYRLCPVCKNSLEIIEKETFKPIYKNCKFSEELKISIAEVKSGEKAILKGIKFWQKLHIPAEIYVIRVLIKNLKGDYEVLISMLKTN